MRSLVGTVACILAFAWLENTGASAAMIERGENICTIELKGPIDAGDADRFEAFAKELGLDKQIDNGEGTNPFTTALCLNSSGGSFLEGQRIARLVHEYGIPTRVGENAQCYSSCAFIFMAGRSLGSEYDTPYRTLHIDGKLGFHAPYTQFGADEPIPGGEVNALVRGYNQIVGEFIEFGNYRSIFDYKPAFSPSLLAKLLTMGPTESLDVTTLEDVERWSIRLDGAKVAPSFEPRALANVCENFQAWQTDRTSDAGGEYLPAQQIATLTGEQNGPTRYHRVDTGGLAERYCLIATEPTPNGGYTLCSVDGFTGVSYGQCPEYAVYVPGRYSSPPKTALSALGGLVEVANGASAGSQAIEEVAGAEAEGGSEPSPAPPASPDKWRVDRSINPLDDTPTIVLSLDADAGRSSYDRPITFIARCKSDTTEAYVVWNDYLGDDSSSVYEDWKYVDVRIGERPSVRQRWGVSTDKQATFAPSWAGTLLKEMLTADRLVLRTTPYNENPITAVFDTSGMRTHLAELAATCNWSVPPPVKAPRADVGTLEGTEPASEDQQVLVAASRVERHAWQDARTFEPYSRTAEAITGAITLSGNPEFARVGSTMSITFGNERTVGLVSEGASWRRWHTASDENITAEVFRFSDHPGELQFGNTLCGDAGAAGSIFAVFSEGRTGLGTTTLRMAVFEAIEPPQSINSPGLCGTFFYEL